MVNTAVQLKRDDARPRRRRSRRNAPQERLFCTLREAAVFLELSFDALKQRVKRGTLRGVARAIDGSLWRPAGGSQVLIEVGALRGQLSEDRKQLFDAWATGSLSLAAVKRQIKAETLGKT
jgi:hypothetical protein